MVFFKSPCVYHLYTIAIALNAMYMYVLSYGVLELFNNYRQPDFIHAEVLNLRHSNHHSPSETEPTYLLPVPMKLYLYKITQALFYSSPQNVPKKERGRWCKLPRTRLATPLGLGRASSRQDCRREGHPCAN